MKKIVQIFLLLLVASCLYAGGKKESSSNSTTQSSSTTTVSSSSKTENSVDLYGPWPEGYEYTSNPYEPKPGYYDYPSSTPSDYNVDENITEAADMNIIDFYNAVRNNGEWDYKQEDSSYENLGNFNYGATGSAAGLSENTLERAAGVAQIIAGTSSDEFGTPLGGAPYGDDPNDNYWINEGIKYYNTYN